jgi:hypothetical protein
MNIGFFSPVRGLKKLLYQIMRGCYFLMLGLDQAFVVLFFVHYNSFFFQQSGMFGKINKAIRFPEYLNLSSYMSTTDDYSPVYGLYAVVVHRDVNNAAFSGHYVCYVKDSQGKWHEMDDSQVNYT